MHQRGRLSSEPCSPEVFDPEALEDTARKRLCDEFFALHQRIFTGVDRDRFERKVFRPPARWTRIQMLRNTAGEAVGYCAVHLYDVLVRGRKHAIFRMEAGVLRPYRGRGSTFEFGFRQAVRHKLLRPFERVGLFCTLVHPSSFCLLTSRCSQVFPSPRRRTPPRVQALMAQLAKIFHEREVDPPDPNVRQVDWITLDDPEETASWHRSSHEAARLFLKLNPGYQKGQGLVTFVPLTTRNLALSALKSLRHRRSE